ncbi:MAG: phosphopyruvate hydratase [Desulfobulbaceae bacterium]|uniref:Enolase n=1 Tax=Candidatus Desulfatifera sulfidica TaxID=2841691 RepID=A0A8J6N7L1_9BACT|nr:phosphopyruvate hydratase [Candidatus Desulfatifera sulfidica]
MSTIKAIHAREILDSRGNPTVEVDVTLDSGETGRASVPSGASTGIREAVELRDNDPDRYAGKGVLKAVSAINQIIGPALLGMYALDQPGIDTKMIEMDGAANKAVFGANGILGVSMATARAAALSRQLPLFRSLNHTEVNLLPAPCFNILNGGAHADNNMDFQEFKLVPVGASSFNEALRMGTEVYHVLKGLLVEKGYSTGIGDEGGFAPNLKGNEQAVELILEAVSRAGYSAPNDIAIALDPAVSELWVDDHYELNKSGAGHKNSAEMIDLWESWVRQYPIISIEDGLAEEDWTGWEELTRRLGDRIQLVGDDIFCTNPAIIARAIEQKVGNAVLIKMNQIGTVSETLEAMRTARAAGYTCYISHRSGETTDDFIADLAVATGAGQIKTGAPCRGERLAKYNQLLRIEEMLGEKARYNGWKNFKKPSKITKS